VRVEPELRGLVIKSPWVEHILAGRKTWEIRGSTTKIRGRIALIRGGSGLIVGTCRLTDCRGPLTLEDMKANVSRHQIPLEALKDGLPYSKTFAWVLEDARPLSAPAPYRHPSGAVIWVRLPRGIV
jgi:hypothetical protein